MVKQTQKIGRQKPTNCLSVTDHFMGLSLKGLIVSRETCNVTNKKFNKTRHFPGSFSKIFTVIIQTTLRSVQILANSSAYFHNKWSFRDYC